MTLARLHGKAEGKVPSGSSSLHAESIHSVHQLRLSTRTSPALKYIRDYIKDSRRLTRRIPKLRGASGDYSSGGSLQGFFSGIL